MATFYVDNGYTGTRSGNLGSATNPYGTIGDAVAAASTTSRDTVSVAAGTYKENVEIDRSVNLVSSGGAEVTTIEGQGNTALGTVLVKPNVNDVTIGGAGMGFKVIGIDNVSPGIESAAVYLQGNHSGIDILGNEIVAKGDEGLLSEYSATITDILIDGNTFSGQTFSGTVPGGSGFGNQFTEANVPRQLVVLGSNNGGGASSDITFTNNKVTGTAGGTNAAGQPQGNSLVTIDAADSTIADNEFTGFTNRFGYQLRTREESTDVTGNKFSSAQGGNLGYYVENDGKPGTVSGNAFVVKAGTSGTLQAAINAANSGDAILVGAGDFTEEGRLEVSNKAIAISGALAGTSPRESASAWTDTAGHTTIAGFQTLGTAGLVLDGVALTGADQPSGPAGGEPFSGIQALGSGGLTVKNSTISVAQNGYFSCGIEVGYVDGNVTVGETVFKGFTGSPGNPPSTYSAYGVYLNTSDAVNRDVSITNSVFDLRNGGSSDVRAYGIGIDGFEAAGGLIVSGNTFNNLTYGLRVFDFGDTMGQAASYSGVSDNTFTNAGEESGNIQNYTKFVITTGANISNGIAYETFKVGTEGQDEINGTRDADLIAGNDGEDQLFGGNGNDTIYGGADNDRIDGYLGSDRLEGGTGVDTAYGYEKAVTLSVVGNQWQIKTGDDTDSLNGIEKVEANGKTFLLVGAGGFATIQAAVDAAGEGDTIYVADGSYDENVTIDVKGVTLQSVNKGGATIAGGVTIGYGATDATVDGFRITETVAGNEQSSIFILANGAVITNNTLVADTAEGTGIVVGGGAGGAAIGGNSIGGYGAGVYVNPGSGGASSVTGNTFIGNGEGLIFEAGPSVDEVSGNAFSSSGANDIRVSLRTSGNYDLSGVVGTNTYSGGDVRQVNIRTSGDSTVTGTALNDRIEVASAGTYADLGVGVTFNGGAGNDTLIGGAGDDTLNGGIGNDALEGGAGTGDTAVYGAYANYEVTQVGAAGRYLVRDRATGDTDAVTGVENFNFNGKVVSAAAAVAQAPVASPVQSPVSVAENTTPNGPIADVNATDANSEAGDTVTFSITGGNAGNLFTINAATGEISLAAGRTLDFEAQQSHTLTVRATDSGGLTGQTKVVINVADVNERPTIAAQTTASAAENIAAGTLITTVSASDPDVGGGNDAANNFENVSYAITGGNAGGLFAINTATGAISLAAGKGLDFEGTKSYDLTVTAKDGPGLSASGNVRINVTNVNEAPTDIALSSSAVAENSAGAVVGELSGSDVDAGDALAFAVTDASSPFEVRVVEGRSFLALKSGVSLDFEAGATRSVTVKATDKAGATFSEVLTVNVGNANEAPQGISLSNRTVSEAVAGAVVGTLSATDPDGDAVTFTVNDSRFRVDTSGGTAVLRLKDGVALDYERLSNVNIAVAITASDGNLKSVQSFTIAVQDVNEAPAGQGVQNSNAIERGATQAPLGIDPLTDPEGRTLTYKVGNLPGQGAVTLDGTAIKVGQVLSAAQLADLDYTAPDNASGGTIGFTASDGTNNTALTVNLSITPAVSKTYTGSNSAERLDGAAGNDVVLGRGGDDTLFGGSGNDTLDGGTGADTMRGGTGNDTYVVDNAGDEVIEAKNQGLDTVKASVSFNLAGIYVENLELTGSKAINGTGNSLNNTITGNGAANTLKGEGGDDRLEGGWGKDTLSGGAGEDTFVFDQRFLKSFEADVITDFVSKDDTMELASRVFQGLKAGELEDYRFKEIGYETQTKGVDKSDRILYEKDDGELFFDRDGSGSKYGRVKFAELKDNTDLGHTDFLIV